MLCCVLHFHSPKPTYYTSTEMSTCNGTWGVYGWPAIYIWSKAIQEEDPKIVLIKVLKTPHLLHWWTTATQSADSFAIFENWASWSNQVGSLSMTIFSDKGASIGYHCIEPIIICQLMLLSNFSILLLRAASCIFPQLVHFQWSLRMTLMQNWRNEFNSPAQNWSP